MRPLSTTESPHLDFNRVGDSIRKFNARSDRIGWIHTLTDKPGAKFDIVIKDALGRIKAEKKGCSTQTCQYGELVNLPTMLGEELQVEVLNIQNTDTIKVFLN